MIESIISTSGLMMGALLFVLLARMVALSQETDKKQKDREQEAALDATTVPKENDDISVLLDAQRFASQQLEGSSSGAEDLTKLPEAEQEAMALYLIAAIEYMGRKKQCSAKFRRITTIKVLETQLGLNASTISKYCAMAFSGKLTTLNESYMREGAVAAKKWLVNPSIPERFSFHEQEVLSEQAVSFA